MAHTSWYPESEGSQAHEPVRVHPVVDPSLDWVHAWRGEPRKFSSPRRWHMRRTSARRSTCRGWGVGGLKWEAGSGRREASEVGSE